ncbi:hypothetical protein SARC_14028 [Sphaeroforma arctica JP610]|uniref:NADH dehydrogenase [ubiquinone] 1 beta subcomplex subunit 10 n=1 Tax=Sphaeroforma arctica JP610 TaxID=667725 RepID=A0A0L0FA50_9EUKA|nr:hypothetical protein SARC_14028 [Sphaeroforma arctica JP610]KNC73416.1 hypothetical protein SARC_14028 [Sphaeroforma arctica JP610]|eukprot:XP_014147318.1 hypothetical protein SARC_14028 [Sphaeroforma arctica JP610]
MGDNSAADAVITRAEERKLKAVNDQVHNRYVKILRKEVTECYRREGVNHEEKCKDLVEAYWQAYKGRQPKGPPEDK